MASRIEALTRQRRVAALVSAETVAAAGPDLPDADRARLRRAAPASLRGREGPVELWAAA